MSTITNDHQYTAGSHAAFAVADTAVPLTEAIYQPTSGAWHGWSATMVVISLHLEAAGPLYFTLDGTAPLTDGTLGHQLNPGDTLKIKNIKNIINFMAIRKGSTSTSFMATGYFNDTGK